MSASVANWLLICGQFFQTFVFRRPALLSKPVIFATAFMTFFSVVIALFKVNVFTWYAGGVISWLQSKSISTEQHHRSLGLGISINLWLQFKAILDFLYHSSDSITSVTKCVEFWYLDQRITFCNLSPCIEVNVAVIWNSGDWCD